jgi:tetratricopeptide (TPR) repeat protein
VKVARVLSIVAGVAGVVVGIAATEAGEKSARADAGAAGLPPGTWSGGRPPECNPDGQGNVWERLKEVSSGDYCRRLADGAALLAGSGWVAPALAQQALAAGDDAEKLAPGHAAPSVLRARALVALRKPKEAGEALARARQLDARALDDVATSLAAARALALAGKMEDARAAYAALLPRASSLPLAARAPVFFEAGLASMQRGPSGIEEAVARFRELLRGSQEEMQTTAVAALALALDRAAGLDAAADRAKHGAGANGTSDEASALLAERGPFRVESVVDDRVRASLKAMSAEAEEQALLATLEGSGHLDRARARWKAYLAAAPASTPPEWIARAKEHAGGR